MGALSGCQSGGGSAVGFCLFDYLPSGFLAMCEIQTCVAFYLYL
jgi:hypothetical protein